MVHEIGHNLGMRHDFVDGGRPYTNCRKHSDGSSVQCNKCANYQSDNRRQPLGVLTGDPEDCCNGFMGYYNHPHYWSDCSVRFFQQHYVAENWSKCMEASPGTDLESIELILISKRKGISEDDLICSYDYDFRQWKKCLFCC